MEQTSPTNQSLRKHVLFVVTKSVLGGAQRYVYDLATSLPRDTYDITVAFGGTGEAGSKPGTLSDMLTGAGVRTIFVPELTRDISLSGDKEAFIALKRLFMLERPDIVHLNSSKVGGLGSLAARISKVPKIIFTVHGWPFWEKRKLYSKIFIFISSWISVILSHKTIVISEYDKKAMKMLPFVNKKINVIHNGIRNTNHFSRESARSALFDVEEISNHEDDIWLVSVAELTPNKNLLKAIDAISLINTEPDTKPIFYSIIGIGEQKEEIEKYIADKKASSFVHLSGLVPDSRIYLNAFDAMILPSIKEGVPYVLLEAGLAKLPVIASEVGGIPEVITPGKTGILIKNPSSAESIASAVRIIGDKDLRMSLGESLHEHVASNFSFENMRSKTFNLYTSK